MPNIALFVRTFLNIGDKKLSTLNYIKKKQFLFFKNPFFRQSNPIIFNI